MLCDCTAWSPGLTLGIKEGQRLRDLKLDLYDLVKEGWGGNGGSVLGRINSRYFSTDKKENCSAKLSDLPKPRHLEPGNPYLSTVCHSG